MCLIPKLLNNRPWSDHFIKSLTKHPHCSARTEQKGGKHLKKSLCEQGSYLVEWDIGDNNDV